MLLELFLLLVLGLIFGSFVTALTWRIPLGISYVKGRSICPKCKEQINWYDNIPLFSYIVLGGKCRHCKEHISLRYPIIEISTAATFMLVGFLTFPNFIEAVYYLIVFIILESIFIIDLEHQLIPDSLTFTGILITTIYYIFIVGGGLFSGILAGFIASALLMVLHIITAGRGMGLGDVKFSVFGGMFVGIELLPIWLLLAFLTGGVTGSILVLLGKAKMKTKIAFGPFLIIGIVLALIFGNTIIRYIGI